MVRRKRVTGRTIWQSVLVVSVLVLILFTPFTGTGATTEVNRAFLDAAFNGDTKAVEALLAEGADVSEGWHWIYRFIWGCKKRSQ
jgi:hypothetical protein